MSGWASRRGARFKFPFFWKLCPPLRHTASPCPTQWVGSHSAWVEHLYKCLSSSALFEEDKLGRFLYHSTEFCWIVLEWISTRMIIGAWRKVGVLPSLIGFHCQMHCFELYGLTCNKLNCYLHPDWSNGREERGGSHFAFCELGQTLPLISTNLTAKKQDVRAVCKKT